MVNVKMVSTDMFAFVILDGQDSIAMSVSGEFVISLLELIFLYLQMVNMVLGANAFLSILSLITRYIWILFTNWQV